MYRYRKVIEKGMYNGLSKIDFFFFRFYLCMPCFLPFFAILNLGLFIILVGIESLIDWKRRNSYLPFLFFYSVLLRALKEKKTLLLQHKQEKCLVGKTGFWNLRCNQDVNLPMF